MGWRRRPSSASSSRSSPPSRRARAPASACRWCTASPAGTAAPSSSRASRAGLDLPGAVPGVPGVPRRRAGTGRAAELRGDGERILYLDDEESLVKLAVSFLERLGYRVCGYTRVEDALAAFRAQPDAFDLVVTDYNMPAMSGMDVALAVMSLRPSCRWRSPRATCAPPRPSTPARSASAPPSPSRTPSRSWATSCSACCTRGTPTGLTPPRAARAPPRGAPTMTACDAHRARRLGLSIAARRGGAARRPQPRHRAERQRQVQPVSRAAPARRRRAGARHRVARAGRRPVVGALGGTRDDRAIGQAGQCTRSRARGARARSA